MHAQIYIHLHGYVYNQGLQFWYWTLYQYPTTKPHAECHHGMYRGMNSWYDGYIECKFPIYIVWYALMGGAVQFNKPLYTKTFTSMHISMTVPSRKLLLRLVPKNPGSSCIIGDGHLCVLCLSIDQAVTQEPK